MLIPTMSSIEFVSGRTLISKRLWQRTLTVALSDMASLEMKGVPEEYSLAHTIFEDLENPKGVARAFRKQLTEITI